MKKRNKYEDIEMIEFEDKIDVFDDFIEQYYNTEETIGLIASKEFVEYVMKELLEYEDASISLIDLTSDNKEFIITIDDCRAITVLPECDYKELYDDVDVAYIDMDGDVTQETIDYYVDKDKKVILFGEADDEDDCCPCCKCCSSTTYTKNGKSISKEEYEESMAELDKLYYDEYYRIASDILKFFE